MRPPKGTSLCKETRLASKFVWASWVLTIWRTPWICSCDSLKHYIFHCGEFEHRSLARFFWVDLIKLVSNVRPSVPIRTYIRKSVHPQKVSSISMKFGIKVEVNEWCTMVCTVTRSKVKVKVTSPWNLEILPFAKAISSAIYNGRWQLTTYS